MSSESFTDFDLGPTVLRGVEAMGFVEPRPIQAEAIPAALEGQDILGLAQTGTGKTAAFSLPIIEKLLARQGGPGPQVLIVAPTRELASQIRAEFDALARFTRIKSTVVFGGVSVNNQIKALRERPQVVVACPGRLLDLMGQGAVRLDRVHTLVLDEADHMFDMGFLPDIRRILAALPEKRQNLLFSATMPKEIRRLAKQVLSRPHVVELNHTRPIETVEHAIYPIDQKQKVQLLERILGGDDFVSAIVFTRTKHRAKRLAQQLDRSGHRAVALQGNMSQNARERAMSGFRKRDYDVLVATDIAARGIDVEQVSHVVNFDMPSTTDAYTHRIGRTGRAERSGKAYTLVTVEDRDMVDEVEARLGEEIARRSVEGIASVDLPPNGSGRNGNGARRNRHGSRPTAAPVKRPTGGGRRRSRRRRGGAAR
jgi:ATP-dependent RNA helicase RhlE